MSKDNTISTLYLKTQNKIGLQYLGVTSKDAYSYKGSGEVWKKKIKEYGRKKSDIDTLVLFTDKMKGKSTSKLFQEVSLWTSKMLGVVDNVNFANTIEEKGILGAYGTTSKKYDWTGQSKFNKWVKKNKEQSSDDVIYQTTDTYEDKKSSNLDLDEEMYEKQMKIKLVVALSKLTAREERVLRMRFGIGVSSDYTLEEVGQQFWLTRDRIRQIEAKALRKLKSLKLTKYLFDNLDMVA